MDEITPTQLAERLAQNQPLALLDVREPDERRYCALPAGPARIDLHVPIGTVTASLPAIAQAAGERPLVVYCHHGVRSAMVAQWLSARLPGPVLNLEGGVEAWAREVDPHFPRY